MPLQVEEKFMLKLLSFSYVCIFSFQWILINHHQKPWCYSFSCHRQSQSWEVGSLDIENCREASRSSCTEEELDEEDVPDPVEEESQDVPPDPVDAPEEAPGVKKKKRKEMKSIPPPKKKEKESQDDPSEEDPVDAREEAPEVKKKKGDENDSSSIEERKDSQDDPAPSEEMSSHPPREESCSYASL